MARALLLAAALLLVTSCGGPDVRAPFAESRTPPGLAARFMAPEGWAWSFVQVGEAPVQRYGVAAPSGAPRAQVLILTGYGESAEGWFETVRDLNARGTTVWVLERAGQGGSGRYAAPRDLGHVSSLEPDVGAVRAMVSVVIRPDGRLPFVVLAHDDAAVVALRAAETGMKSDGLILSTPRWPAASKAAKAPALLRALGVGAKAHPGWTPWRREGPDAFASELTHDRDRGRVQHAWQIANPDLRMAGPSVGWRAAFDQARRTAGERLGDVRAPVLLLLPGRSHAADRDLCKALPRCTSQVIPGARPALHLERDAERRVWLTDVARFVTERARPRA